MDQSDQPQIEYPCLWEYKIIGKDADKMREAVGQILGNRAYSLTPSHESSGGKYVSLTIELTVHDEQFRVELFETFRSHTDIRMVL